MEFDDVCGVAVLFHRLHGHAGVLRAFAQIRHPLQPLGTTKRERLIHRDGVKQVQLRAGGLGERQPAFEGGIAPGR